MKIDFARLKSESLSALVGRKRATGERLEVVRYEYQPGARFSRHQHEAEQLTFVMSGVLVFELASGDVRLTEGQAILIRGDEPHGAHVPDGAGVTETLNVFSPVRTELPSG